MLWKIKKKFRKQKISWEELKKVFPEWHKVLKDAASEVRDIQVGIWFSIFAFLLSVIFELILKSEMVPNWIIDIIPSALIALFVGYVGIVIAWACSAVKFHWLKFQWEHIREEAVKFCEIGEISKKPFDYIIRKLELFLLDKDRTPPSKIMFISPFDESSFGESKNLLKLANNYNIPFEWYITENTPLDFRTEYREALQEFVTQNLGNIYLTGELTIFNKLLVIPDVTIIAFIGNIWFSWDLADREAKIDQIKEKIVLTPFKGKIDQFFGKQEVHKAISCYLSEIVNMEGFLIGAEYPYLWIDKPEKLFQEFTGYQKRINAKFEEISDVLRPNSKHITANLPLLDNYEAIIKDEKIREWLLELKGEAQKRSELQVDRYIYIKGQYENGSWLIDDTYLHNVCSFLQQEFFSNLPKNYKIWVILADEGKLRELFQEFRGALVTFPFKEIVSNWIWFECKDGYHVLQYETSLGVEKKVAEALAKQEVEEKKAEGKLSGDETRALDEAKAKYSKISLFMFNDGVNPNSQNIMNKYLDYKNFLVRYRGRSNLFLPLLDFLNTKCKSLTGKS
jgi:hypothetical protein